MFKHNSTIPRLELISTHMGANLVQKKNGIRKSKREISHRLARQHKSLYWLNVKGNYRQFVRNIINKIREKEFIS